MEIFVQYVYDGGRDSRLCSLLLTARALTNSGSLIDNVIPQTSIEAAAAITTA